MSFVGIIIAVIAFIFYIARSVEKQNENERKRRQERRGRIEPGKMIPVSDSKDQIPDQPVQEKKPEPESETVPDLPASSEWQKKMLEASRRLEKAGAGKEGPPDKPFPAKKPESPGPGDWIHQPERVRQAFILSECIGKPRALRPHRFYKRPYTR
ncbi:hypothetical protein ABNN70_12910 [Sporolactobacillus sp. Y61]|jgi:hypothetical protein|uniref:Uncharacterized protein n=1 Tax=Sporolactobacillus sp. Y61 TaxID=3160863 RepID=A0AAU8IEA2_9BACL|nr:hypothetical protein [Sporolactobacillus sp. THM19-2]RYL90398.1 hypothetical protein EWH91_09595 [Sporolactobacillus sp. THM19-2]